jgi:hypothetical protein
MSRLEWIKDFRARMGVDLQTACRAWEQIEHTRNLMRECSADMAKRFKGVHTQEVAAWMEAWLPSHLRHSGEAV